MEGIRPINLVSAPRSGSVFLMQIFKILSANVHTSHRYMPGANVIVFRDFRDSALSLYRVHNNRHGKRLKNDFIIDDARVLNKIIQEYEMYTKMIEQFVGADHKALYFVYEFDIKSKNGNKYETIFSKIENYFNTTISESKRQLIKESTNFDINLKRSQQFHSWGGWDKNGIHGKHLHKGDLNLWKNHLDPFLHDHKNLRSLERRYEKCIKKLGYEF